MQRKTGSILIPRKLLSSRGSLKEQDLKLKLAIVGPGGCGKSAIAVRMLSRRFIFDYCPVLEDTYYRIMSIDDVKINLDIMDTSEPFGPMFSNTGDKIFTIGAARDPTRWSSWADVIILVYSITSKESLKECMKILQASEELAVPVIAVGAKNDLEHLRQVTASEAYSLLDHCVVNILETSALESQDSIDLLLASALKEHMQSPSSILTKSPEQISHLMVSTPSMKRKDGSIFKRKESYWSRMPFFPKYSL